MKKQVITLSYGVIVGLVVMGLYSYFTNKKFKSRIDKLKGRIGTLKARNK